MNLAKMSAFSIAKKNLEYAWMSTLHEYKDLSTLHEYKDLYTLHEYKDLSTLEALITYQVECLSEPWISNSKHATCMNILYNDNLE